MNNNNLKTLSIFYFVWGGINLFAAFSSLLAIVLGIWLFYEGENTGDIEALAAGVIYMIYGSFLFLFLAVYGILSLLVGSYIKKPRNRIFCLVIAGIACINFPLGTALGVFTFIELEKPNVKSLFEKKS
jgi:hypothetical protein